jgi:hypothetical protein
MTGRRHVGGRLTKTDSKDVKAVKETRTSTQEKAPPLHGMLRTYYVILVFRLLTFFLLIFSPWVILNDFGTYQSCFFPGPCKNRSPELIAAFVPISPFFQLFDICWIYDAFLRRFMKHRWSFLYVLLRSGSYLGTYELIIVHALLLYSAPKSHGCCA